MKVLTVVGNRPQFVKAAPLSIAFRDAGIDEAVAHTGQHWDDELSQVFIDELGTYTSNMSKYDFDYSRKGDTEAYGRTRGRFDVIGEIGKAKAVLGIELDMYYGQTGSNDNNIQGNVQSAGSGASGGFDLNTDSRTIFELKWLYTEFPLPIPLPNTVRLGAQPFGTLATDKLALVSATLWLAFVPIGLNYAASSWPSRGVRNDERPLASSHFGSGPPRR